MGCAASSAIHTDPGEAATAQKAMAEFERQFAKAREAQDAPTNDALHVRQQFELTTPMLVMPFGVFKAQGRIMKSTKAWRDKALAAGSLVVHEEGSGKIVIFVSHTWWDRAFTDATNDPNNPYDKGAPDWQTGEKRDLKWRVICAGVQRLLEQEGLKEEDVSLWVDWQSIYQDDEAEKLKGVVSLIRYVTLCQYMLVPIEQGSANITWGVRESPQGIPVYGDRGWCRAEYFVFSLLAEMQGHEVQLYAVPVDGALIRYPKVEVRFEDRMPSGGALSNPKDKALVTALEDKMIEAYGTALVELTCKAAGGERVDLHGKMLRSMHVGALFAAVERYQVAELELADNQLGAEGGALVAAALKTNTTLSWLCLYNNKLGPEGGVALAEALKRNTALKELDLSKSNLGPEGGVALAKALKSNTTLKTFKLSGNKLGPEGGVALAEALKRNTALKGLILCDSALGPEGGVALAEGLKSNTTLSTLFLNSNSHGPEGGVALAEALKRNRTLTWLSLAGNTLSRKGGVALAEALKRNRTLTRLDLTDSCLGNEGGMALAAAVKGNRTLKTLGLETNRLSSDAKQALRAAAGSGLKLNL